MRVTPGTTNGWPSGAGTDTVDYSSRTEPINASIGNAANDGGASDFDIASQRGDDITGDIENVIGGSGDDTIIGNSRDGFLIGAGGRNTITVGSGSQLVQGGITQAVLLDFDSATVFGEHVYTQEERDAIQHEITTNYMAPIQATLLALPALVLVEAHMREELPGPVVAERGVGEGVAGLRPGACLDRVAVQSAGDANAPHRAGLTHDVLDGVRGIHDEVEHRELQ